MAELKSSNVVKTCVLSKDVVLTEEDLDYIAGALLDYYDPDDMDRPQRLYSVIVDAKRIGVGDVGRFGF